MKIKTVSLTVATTASILYVGCILYGIIFVPNSTLHHQFFELLVGFKWLDITSFVSGLIQVFIWGLLAGSIFAYLFNYFSKQ